MSSTRRGSTPWTYFMRSVVNHSTVAKCMFCDEGVPFQDTEDLRRHLRERHRQETNPRLWSNDDDDSGRKTVHIQSLQHKERLDEDAEAADVIVAESERLNPHRGFEASDDDERKEVCREVSVKRKRPLVIKNKRSLAWKCFKKSEKSPGFCICTICGRAIRQMSSNTTNLLKHIFHRHPVEYKLLNNDKFSSLLQGQHAVVLKSRLPSRPCIRPKRRSRSIVWKYFAKCAVDHCQVLCTFCGRMLKQPLGSTSNLIKHLLAKHHKEYTKLFPEDSSEMYIESFGILDETDENEFATGGEQTKMGVFEESPKEEEVILSEAQIKSFEDDHGFDSVHGNMEEEREAANMAEMTAKVQPIWQKYCEERERQFSELMNGKKREIEDTYRSIEKFKQQLDVLAEEVEQFQTKRRAEISRQEEMELQFLVEKEAKARKLKHRMAYIKTCSLLEVALSGHTSAASQENCILYDTVTNLDISSAPGCSDEENIATSIDRILVGNGDKMATKEDTQHVYFQT